LTGQFAALMIESKRANERKTNAGHLAKLAKLKEAAAVANAIGGETGATLRAISDQGLWLTLLAAGDCVAAARAASSMLSAARAESGNLSMLVEAMATCAIVARRAPETMAKADKKGREKETRDGSLSDKGQQRPSLSQEGRFRFPTTPAALSQLTRAYLTAAVAVCDAALAGYIPDSDTPVSARGRHIPSRRVRAEVQLLLMAASSRARTALWTSVLAAPRGGKQWRSGGRPWCCCGRIRRRRRRRSSGSSVD